MPKLPVAPPPWISVQNGTVPLPLSLNVRLRTSSAYSPPSTEWLMSSRIEPYSVGRVAARTSVASTVIWPKPACWATCAAVSAKRSTSTSSIAPVNPAPTVNGWSLSALEAQPVTSIEVAPAWVPHPLGAMSAASPSTYSATRWVPRSSVSTAGWKNPSLYRPAVVATSIVPTRTRTRPASRLRRYAPLSRIAPVGAVVLNQALSDSEPVPRSSDGT